MIFDKRILKDEFDNIVLETEYNGCYVPGVIITNNKNISAKILGRTSDGNPNNYWYYLQYEDGSIGRHNLKTLCNRTFTFPLSFRGKSNKENKYHTILKRYYGMHDRCENITCKDYYKYGLRGIQCNFTSVYELYFYLCKLENFENLLNEPNKWELDRVDNNGNYEKGNVRIVTKQQNQRNKSNNHLYNLIDENHNILFTGIKADCEVFIYNLLGIKIHIDAYAKNGNNIGAKQGRKIQAIKLIKE